MAFKLVDNPNSEANKVKQRYRVRELLEDSIPSTEYMVNRSGKYACIVCPQWPVFDTLAMLSKHRNGAKHQEHTETWNKEKLDKILLSEKQQQRDFIKRSAGVIHDKSKGKEDDANDSPLLKKARTLVDDMQKGTLSYDGSIPEESPPDSLKAIWNEPAERNSRPRKDRTPFFQSRFNTEKTQGLKLSLKHHGVTAVTFSNCGKELMTDIDSTSLVSKNSDKEPDSSYSDDRRNVDSKTVQRKKSLNSPHKNIDTVRNKQSHALSSAQPRTCSKDNQKQGDVEYAKYYTRMKQSGWIKNEKGEWVKDENCEFDSDDEPDEYQS